MQRFKPKHVSRWIAAILAGLLATTAALEADRAVSVPPEVIPLDILIAV